MLFQHMFSHLGIQGSSVEGRDLHKVESWSMCTEHKVISCQMTAVMWLQPQMIWFAHQRLAGCSCIPRHTLHVNWSATQQHTTTLPADLLPAAQALALGSVHSPHQTNECTPMRFLYVQLDLADAEHIVLQIRFLDGDGFSRPYCTLPSLQPPDRKCRCRLWHAMWGSSWQISRSRANSTLQL